MIFPPLLHSIFIIFFLVITALDYQSAMPLAGRILMGFLGNWPYQYTSPAKKMPLIDVYVETAAGGENHCPRMGNYFSRLSTSVVIREKRQSLRRDTQDRQTQIRPSKKTWLQYLQPHNLKWQVSDNSWWIGANWGQKRGLVRQLPSVAGQKRPAP